MNRFNTLMDEAGKWMDSTDFLENQWGAIRTLKWADRLEQFAKESNKIEGIYSHDDHFDHYTRLNNFLCIEEITIGSLSEFNTAGSLRLQSGMNVRVGDHESLPGGMHIAYGLEGILEGVKRNEDPYKIHLEFETLHPFMDGNGRTGRALWLWQQVNQQEYNVGLGFMHKWYYDSLRYKR